MPSGEKNYPDKGCNSMPTPEEIRAACERFQKTWPKKRKKKPEPVETKICGNFAVRNGLGLLRAE